jgi:hypothetical protein
VLAVLLEAQQQQTKVGQEETLQLLEHLLLRILLELVQTHSKHMAVEVVVPNRLFLEILVVLVEVHLLRTQ